MRNKTNKKSGSNIPIRLNNEERSMLEKIAEKEHLKLSTWIKQQLFKIIESQPKN